jgi:hypothetical protein
MEFNPIQEASKLEAKIRIDNTNKAISPEIDSISTSMRDSYVKPNLATLMPKDFNPKSDYFFGTSVASAVKPTLEARNYNVEEAYGKLNDGTYIAKYDTFKEGRDNAEYFAQTQSTSDKWLNGFTKFAGQLATGIVGGTVGTVYGIAEGIKEGSFRATYDNDFANYLDDLNQKWDYQLPNYYTKAEKEEGFFGSLGSANFWAKDVLGGAAFTVSAIGSEAIWSWATGGASLAASGARLGMRAERLFGKGAMALKAINKAKDLTLAPVRTAFSNMAKAETLANVAMPVAAATKFGKVGAMANAARFMYTSAGYESGFEARSYIREQRESFDQMFESKNGRQATAEEKKDFEENLTNSANALYGANLAIVGTSNLAIMGKIMDIKNPITSPTRWVNSNIFGAGVKSTEAGLEKIATSKAQKIGQYAWSLSKGPLTEGVWEEGMQSVANNTAKNWVNAKYDPKYTKDTLSLTEAFNEGLSQTYGTKEGMKEVGIGMLIGLFAGSGIGIASGKGINAEFYDVNKRTEGLESLSKYYSPKKMAENFAYANRVQLANESYESANAKGDIVGGELARKSSAIAQLNYAYNLDYFDQTINDTEIAINNIDNQTIMKEHGVDEKGAIALKDSMIQEYKDTAKTYKKYRDFSEYFVGNNLSKEKDLLGDYNADNVREAIAYELTLGESAHSFSGDLLQAIKQKVGTSILGTDISNALNIEDILLKAGKETKVEATKKEKQAKAIAKEIETLDNEYLNLEATFNNTRTDEEKKTFLSTMDSNRAKKTKLEKEREVLTSEYNALLSSAKLKNPFGKYGDEVFISTKTLEDRVNKVNNINEIIKAHQTVDPQEALQLEKLVKEYSKSIYAFQRYAELSRQLSDPTLGLRGKRNIISEIMSDKSPNQTTVETLEKLMEGYGERLGQNLEEIVSQQEDVEKVISEDKEKKGATIDKVDTEETIAKEEGPKKSIKDTVLEMIKNSPYLLDYFGEGVPVLPTQEELDEYTDLASRAINDPKIDNDTVAYKNPYSYNRLTPTTRPSLKKAEVARLQELNNKMSKWGLLGAYSNAGGVSIKDMLLQDIAVNQSVDPIITSEVTEDELVTNSNVEPKQTDKGDGIRNEEVLQVYQDVFIKRNQTGTTISHLSLPGLLSRMDISDSVGYAQITTEKGKQVIKKGSIKTIDISQVGDNLVPGATFVVTFSDGETATISVKRSGALLINKAEDFAKVFDAAGLRYVDNTLTNKAGFSPVYDQDTGKKLSTDYTDTSEYSPMELYNMIPGNSVTFSINLASEYNQKLIADYLAAAPEQEEEASKELANNLKINVIDIKGRKLGDLKANYETNESPEFLLLREEAAKLAKEKEADVSDIDIRLSKESFIKHIFLGVPNFVFENGSVKYFDIVPDAIVDYGYVQDGEVSLKGNTKNVRMDYVKDLLKKEGLPIAVFKQGQYLVAFPMNLKEGGTKIGDKALETLMQSDSLGKGVLELNNTLANNGISPSSYNLFYLSEDNQSLFTEDKMTKSLEEAINKLNEVKQVADVTEWMSPDHTKENLVDQASIAIDITNNPLTSPKPIINLNRMVEFKDDWYAEALRTGELSDEKAIEIATKIFSGDSITPKESNFVDDPKVVGVISQLTKLEDDLDAASRSAQNEPC